VLQHSHLKKCILIHDVIHISQCFEKKITNKKLFKFFQQLDSNIVFFYNSTYTRNDFLEIFPSYRANKNLVALLAADAKKFYPLTQLDPQIRSHTLKKYGIPTKDKYILSLCSLNPRKNLPFLVEGFAKFLELHPTVKDLNLVLAGPPGWQLEGLEKKINDYPTLRSKIIRTGYLEPSDINLIYNTALCFTYLSLYEGFGLPLLEAMCCGLPVIAAKTTSLPEVYGDAALSINPHNLSELVTALENIYFHPQQRHQLQQKSLARSQLFSWQKTAAVFSKEYLTNIRPSSQTE
jgi:glycosyltransferase involved in cell wall biosynthesis